VQFGVLLGDVPGTLDPRDQLDTLLRQAAAAQEAGFALLTIGQHFLYGDVRWLQPVPTLARLSAEVDGHVRLATTVLIAPLHEPVLLAEELATLDIVTGGRLIVGLGTGYRREEYRQLGVPWSRRVARLEEAVPLLRALWSQHEVSAAGPTWRLAGARPHVRPLQQPLPVWIGASGPEGVRRAARLGDAWPIGPRLELDEVASLLAVYEAERVTLAQPVGLQPIRREIVLGPDEATARERFTAMTSVRYAQYAQREIATTGGPPPGQESAAAMVGTPGSVRRQLLQLAGELPVGPVIVRAQWPGMDASDVAAYLSELGREVVRPLASACPTRTAG
jgi:alkanesulfonate monooxygenase SsuD/methylene tetrahydromethanopterin reductase-like flavin-dependent oxidoreductase (luciferase family)